MKESQTEPYCSPTVPDNKHAVPNRASFRGKKPLLQTQFSLQFMKSVYRCSSYWVPTTNIWHYGLQQGQIILPDPGP